MKLLSLNIWGGQVYEPLTKFLKSQKDQIDIFCFQEVFKSKEKIISSKSRMDIYYDIERILKGYDAYYSPTFKGRDLKKAVNFDVHFGPAIFIKKNIKIIKEGSVFIHRSYNEKVEVFSEKYGKYIDFPRTLQYLILEENEVKKLIINIHGYWNPDTKNDTPQSLEQVKKIIKFLNSNKCEKIICGDFNLNLDTKSIKLFEKTLINLIRKFDIKSTRSNLHNFESKYADYIFVSKGIDVLDFKALDEHVSDHLPLFIEFK